MQDTLRGDSKGPGFGGAVAAATKWGGAALSLLLVVSLIIWAYRLGTRDAQAVPVIKAMTDPARVAPENPGGLIAEHQGLEVNEILAGGEAGTPDAAELAPGPDTLAAEDLATGNLPPIEEADEATVAALDTDTAEAVDDVAAESEAVLVVPGGDIPGGPPRASDRPIPRPANLAAVAPAPSPGNNAASDTPAPTPVTDTQVPAGTRTVQIGAFDSPGDATSQWQRLQSNHADLLGGHSNYIQKAESNNRTFFRLRVLGFDEAAQQNAMCEALKARGVECIPVTVR